MDNNNYLKENREGIEYKEIQEHFFSFEIEGFIPGFFGNRKSLKF